MAYRREDRINLRKQQVGIVDSEPTINELDEGVVITKSIPDHKTGKYKTVQYIKNGSNIVKSEFGNINESKSSYESKWVLSKEVDISSTGTTKAIFIKAGTYLMDVRIIITGQITAGSMDVDVGIGSNTDVFIDGWDGTAGSHAIDTINAFGRGSSATETGVKLGKFFDDDDTADISVNTAATSGKVKLMAWLVRNPLIST